MNQILDGWALDDCQHLAFIGIELKREIMLFIFYHISFGLCMIKLTAVSQPSIFLSIYVF
jgi:hypothetical protein